MAVSDWSTSPDANTTIDGVNIAEGCPAGNINAAIRRVMAGVRGFYNGVGNTADAMLKAGGAFTGQITRSGRGGYLHQADPANAGGAVYIIASGGALPSGLANGDLVLEVE